MGSLLGEGEVLWRGVKGLCPACPGGGGGGGEGGAYAPSPLTPALPIKRVGDTCTCCVTPGP
jgi:hypothetical protein